MSNSTNYQTAPATPLHESEHFIDFGPEVRKQQLHNAIKRQIQVMHDKGMLSFAGTDFAMYQSANNADVQYLAALRRELRELETLETKPMTILDATMLAIDRIMGDA